MSETHYVLRIPKEAVSEVAAEGMRFALSRAKRANTCDMVIRKDAKDEHHEADWLKYAELEE